jgi:hypothetical protein
VADAVFQLRGRIVRQLRDAVVETLVELPSAAAAGIRITGDDGLRLDVTADAYEMALKRGLRVTVPIHDGSTTIKGTDGATVTYAFKRTA